MPGLWRFGGYVTIELTNLEAMEIAYALQELAGRRYEQALDWHSEHPRKEADQLTALAAKIRKHIPKP